MYNVERREEVSSSAFLLLGLTAFLAVSLYFCRLRKYPNGVLGQKLRYALYLRVTTSCVIRVVPSEKKSERNNHFERLRTFCTNVPVLTFFSGLTADLGKGPETNQRDFPVLLFECFLYPDVAKVEDASDPRRPRVKP